MTKNKTIYFVGVGPGDPGLMTLKAVDLIKQCDVLFVPVRKKNTTTSLALNVVQKAVDVADKKIVYLPFPMVKGTEKIMSALAPAADMVRETLDKHPQGVFITLGCSTIYSTAGNLFLVLKDEDIVMHFVPGVSAISGSAADATSPLVFSEEKLVVLPTTYAMDQIESCLSDFDTVVLMKVHSSLDVIRTLIERKGLPRTSFIVEKATTHDAKIHSLASLPEDYRPHYMSTVVIRRNI